MSFFKIYKMKVYDYNGNLSLFSSPSLRDKSVIAVFKDGIGMTRIKTSGTPSGKEVTYFSATGSILLTSKEPGEEIRVLYQNATP